jgi:UDP-N-acetylglucosamine acyltransferase
VKAYSMAMVSPMAKIGLDVKIGAFCVVEPDVTIEDGCVLESFSVVKSGTTLGPNNHVFEGAILGGLPQHVHIPEHPGRLVIGAGNTIREYVTVHRALEEEESTVIGDNNLLMAYVHVAHDCRVGNNTIFTNAAALAGHVTVEERAYVSGGVGVHQFCRIGTLAMVGGHARITKDIPPYVTIDGQTGLVVGLNVIGLRRAGFTSEQLQQLKEAYRVIYRSGLAWTDVLKQLQTQFTDGPAAHFYQFLSTTTRGIVPERRLPPGATIKLRRDGVESDAPATEQVRQMRAAS